MQGQLLFTPFHKAESTQLCRDLCGVAEEKLLIHRSEGLLKYAQK
jgi:hypothetical protein